MPTPSGVRPGSTVSMTPMIRPLHAISALALAAASSGCSLTAPFSQGSSESVDTLIRSTRYQEALDLAVDLAERSPNDTNAQGDLIRAEAAWLVDQGRDLVFAGEHPAALATFQAAAERLPENISIQNWVLKAEGELAADHRAMAFDAEGAGDFERAAEHYSRALYYTPADSISMAGLERVQTVAAHRAEKATEYYRRGIRTLRRLQVPEALHNFQANQKFAPEDEAGLKRQIEVEGLLGEERRRIGAELESQGLFRGALLEYRLAEEYGGESEELTGDIERMVREVEVEDLLAEAERMGLAGDFDGAYEILGRAGEKTELLLDRVEGARNQILADNIDRLYDRALELEEDFRYPEAIEVYTSLLDQSGGFYLDAISRRDTLSDHVADANRLYMAARETTDVDERIRYLRQIQLIWPTYEDVAEVLAQLE